MLGPWRTPAKPPSNQLTQPTPHPTNPTKPTPTNPPNIPKPQPRANPNLACVAARSLGASAPPARLAPLKEPPSPMGGWDTRKLRKWLRKCFRRLFGLPFFLKCCISQPKASPSRSPTRTPGASQLPNPPRPQGVAPESFPRAREQLPRRKGDLVQKAPTLAQDGRDGEVLGFVPPFQCSFLGRAGRSVPLQGHVLFWWHAAGGEGGGDERCFFKVA